MQCADVDAADANSRRVKHVYSLHESNKAVIQRQMSEWAPVDMRVMPKQIKVIECPYGKSKAHIVLAHIFACEAFQTQPQPALGAQVVSHSDVGQTLALDWKLQCTDANPSPDGKVSAAPGVPNAASGQAQDRCVDGASSQAEAGAQAGEDTSPENAIHSASAQHPEPAQSRSAGQRPAEEAAGEKQSGVDGEAPPEAPCSSAPLRPSRDPRLWPGRAPDAAKPGSTAAAAAVEVVDLISDSEDEHPPVAGPSHTARQTERATAKEDNPPSFVAGPVTPQQLPQALPASRRTDTAAQAAHAADTWQREAARVAPAAATAGTAAATPASRRKPQKVGKKPGRPAAAVAAAPPLNGAGMEAAAVPGGGQRKGRKRRRPAEDAPAAGADLRTQTADPWAREGDLAWVRLAGPSRRSRQPPLPILAHKQAAQDGAPQKAAAGRPARKLAAALVREDTARANAFGLPGPKATRSVFHSAEAAQVEMHPSAHAVPTGERHLPLHVCTTSAYS